jgi:hypothetical protein
MSKQLVVRIVVALLIALMLAGNITPVTAQPAEAPLEQADWTLMVYIVGDNNLDEYVPLDIETELAPTGSNADVSVVALADRLPTAEWSQTLLFYVTQGMTATPENAVDDWGEANMGDPQTLIDFIEWTKDNYPAEHYALSLWNHGWSWRPGMSMYDETNNDTLDQHELDAVLSTVGPIDVIMYDACQMATIENQATVRAYSQAIVASQEWVNWDGIEYELVIPALQANPAMSADELAVFINYSTSTGKERTYSAVALDERWDALVAAVDDWAYALEAGLPEHRNQYAGAFHGAQTFWGDPTARDLYDIASRVYQRVDDPAIQQTSLAVMAAVEGAVLDEWHVKHYAYAHGISIFLPLKVDDLDDPSTLEWNEFDYYRNVLTFGKMSHWDEFIAAYLEVP